MNEIYTYTIPLFINQLTGLKAVLAKASAFIAEQGMDESKLLADRLWEDMFPFAKQVQIACDNAKGAAARLGGVEAPKFEDTEQTIAELQARIDKTLEFVKSVPEASFADAANRQIILPYFKDKYLTGFDYARFYAIPNFYFHCVTAYDIVRKNGVPIGKAEYSAMVPFKDLPQ